MRIGRRGAVAGVGLCLALAGFAALSDRSGAPVTWVVTAGTSMQPEIAPGTLVVVQRRAAYEVGDVVAYRSQDLGQTVLHRVIEVGRDGRLVLKGDANDWVDPVSPTPDDVLGERALQVGGVGRVLGLLRSPAALGVVAALLALGLLPRGRTRRRRSSSGGFQLPPAGPTWEPDPEPEPLPVRAASSDSGFLVVAQPLRASPAVEAAVAAGAVGCLLLGLLATAGPFVRQDSAPRSAEHVVGWSYGAEVAPGVVYPDGVVRTGDPLYTRLVPVADVAATLQLSAPQGARFDGSWRLAVTITDDSGWRRQSYLGQRRAVTSGATLTVRLPMVELRALARRAAQESGVEASGRRVTVQALLDLTLDADGRQRPVVAAPALDFTLDDRQARLADAAQLEQRGEVALPAAVAPRAFSLLGVTLPAGQVRLAALGGGLLALLVLGLLRAGRRGEDEDARIARTAGHLLVAMHDLDEPRATVDVATFDALAALAARYDRVVLFGDCDGLRVYLVLEDGVAYRYYSSDVASALAAAATRPAPPQGQSWTPPQPRRPASELARR